MLLTEKSVVNLKLSTKKERNILEGAYLSVLQVYVYASTTRSVRTVSSVHPVTMVMLQLELRTTVSHAHAQGNLSVFWMTLVKLYVQTALKDTQVGGI